MRRARLALVLCAAAGCSQDEVQGSRALFELERLCFVPPADCMLLPSADLSLRHALVFDRFEFTRADLHYYWPDHRERARAYEWSTDAARDAPERAQWPAFVDFHEAVELAGLRGMRLPEPEEWLHVAVGRRLAYATPWGGAGREFFANTVVIQDGQDFSLKMPCNVGTYENGRSRPFGCYDLLGNVWEWVDGVVLGIDTRPLGEGDELDDAGGTKSSILGGAFDTRWRTTFELDRVRYQQRFHARTVDKLTLAPSIGVRMCAEADDYLWHNAARWGEDADAHSRVRAVGARWATEDPLAPSTLRALLGELRARPGAPRGLSWLEEGLNAER